MAETTSRTARFVKQVVSSYLLTGAGLLYGFISVPLALHYLRKTEFALWALMTQVMMYFILIDFGMTPALSRTLIDHKDHPETGQYGGLVQTGFLVSMAQGLLIFGLGWALAPWLAVWLRIEWDLRPVFLTLLRWQFLLTAWSYALRPFRYILHAHNRNDVTNYTQAALFGVNLIVLWVAFALGWGVYSILWSHGAGVVIAPAVMGLFCWRQHFLPQRGQWGRPTWRQFVELFNYGRDVFLVHLGSLLTWASQNFILSNRLGLEAVALWTVGTKVFGVLSQMIFQIFDYSTPSLSEMMVRGEIDRLRRRYTELLVVSLALATAIGVVYAATNSLFVTVWTSGKIAWSLLPDILLAVWLLPSVFLHMSCGFVLITKRVAGMRYVYFIEGLAFVLLGAWLVKYGGIPAMIAVSILCSLAFSGAYGWWHGNRYFGFRVPELEKEWLGAIVRVAGPLIPCATVLWLLSRPLTPLHRLVLHGIILSILAVVVVARWGLPASVADELCQRAPRSVQPLLRRLRGRARQ